MSGGKEEESNAQLWKGSPEKKTPEEKGKWDKFISKLSGDLDPDDIKEKIESVVLQHVNRAQAAKQTVEIQRAEIEGQQQEEERKKLELANLQLENMNKALELFEKAEKMGLVEEEAKENLKVQLARLMNHGGRIDGSSTPSVKELSELASSDADEQ
ncbi:MAG: hypothetical protein AAF591_18995 [Verrucomicrobiota bacterium]